MHDSAFEKARTLRAAYLAPYEASPLTVLDVGSAVVAEGHRSNREAMTNHNWRYIGLDMEAGPNVDVVVAEPYDWREVADASVDVVTCSQVFEHAQFFWLTILEIGRVLRPGGLAIIIAPGSGPLHRYPMDCWRFYDDGLPTLAQWADLAVVEARVQWRPVYPKGDQWRDAAIVMQRPIRDAEEEARVARKTSLAKSAWLGTMPEAAGGNMPAKPQASIIAPQESKDALLKREESYLKERGSLRIKATLMGKHWRNFWRVLGTPARDLIG
jgi:SAM-dependent methyltransferase